jgi:ubiquinol oxidase
MKHNKLSDYFALTMTKIFRLIADNFFAKRYGHRAVVLETIAGVPGMVAGVCMHFKSLRNMKTGWGPYISEMLAEAENERMHLMIFIEIAQPNWFERRLVLLTQGIFSIFYFILFVLFPRTAHKMIAYFEEEAVKSYTDYLEMVESGKLENIPAPQIAIDYYEMKKSAKLSDLIVKVREDERSHSIVNHKYADLNSNDAVIENKPEIKGSLFNNYKLEKFSEGIIRIEKN